MGYNNNNAGMHTVFNKNRSFDPDLMYYEKKERKKREEEKRRKELEERGRENRNYWLKMQFDNRVNSYKEIGSSLVDIVSSNIAYYAVKNEVHIMKVFTEINDFIQKYANEFEEASGFFQNLFYLGILADRLDVKTEDLFHEQREMITEFFIDFTTYELEHGLVLYEGDDELSINDINYDIILKKDDEDSIRIYVMFDWAAFEKVSKEEEKNIEKSYRYQIVPHILLAANIENEEYKALFDKANIKAKEEHDKINEEIKRKYGLD